MSNGIGRQATRNINRLGQKNVKVGTPGGVMSSIFQKLVQACGAQDTGAWNTKMDNYVHDRRNAIPNNKKDQSSAKGNLLKELLKSQMSINVLFKGFRFLDFKEVRFTVTGVHRNGQESTVTEIIGFGPRIDTRTLAMVPYPTAYGPEGGGIFPPMPEPGTYDPELDHLSIVSVLIQDPDPSSADSATGGLNEEPPRI